MVKIRMPAIRPAGAALRGLACALLLLMAALPAVATTPTSAPSTVAFGLIVGYRAGADELAPEHTDRGPWADRRKREQAAWERAAQRSRERTKALARAVGLPADNVGEAGRAALIRLKRPIKGRELDDALRRLRLHPDVAWAEANVLEQRQLTPTDPGWGTQWHLLEPGPGEPAAMNMPPAWDISTGASASPGRVVAVVDSGVRLLHPDLAGRLLAGYDFVSETTVANDGDGGRDTDPSDPGDWVDAADQANPLFAACDIANSSWHGTFIAGQIAAVPNNGLGVAGLHWDARVLPVRVAGKCGALLTDLFDGVRWAAGLPVAGVPANPTPARVINLSFGGSTACTPGYQSMVDDVTAAGALLVVSAGNNATTLRRPADCVGVMTVASVRRDGAKAGYSSFGPNVALSAPGGSTENGASSLLYSTYDSGLKQPGFHALGYLQGTSFAAPQAAGVAALMLGINPGLTPSALIERMKQGARPHTTPMGVACAGVSAGLCDCTPTTCGAGLLDAQRSLQLAIGPAAVIGPVGTVLPGARITLDGRGSVAIPGRNVVSHRWSQVSGTTTVTIPDDTLALTGLQLPAAVEGRWVFRLTVQDNLGDQGNDTVTVVAANPPAQGGGGGSIAWAWGLGLWAWLLVFGWHRRR
jgi:serine protease